MKKALYSLSAIALIFLMPPNARAHPAPDGRTFVIDGDGCHYSNDIERVLEIKVNRVGSELGTYTEKRTADFTFGNLHGVGFVMEGEAEWGGERLYFRENLPALKAALGKMGLHVNQRNEIVEALKIEKKYEIMLRASVHAVDMRRNDRNFSQARSYLECGSL